MAWWEWERIKTIFFHFQRTGSWSSDTVNGLSTTKFGACCRDESTMSGCVCVIQLPACIFTCTFCWGEVRRIWGGRWFEFLRARHADSASSASTARPSTPAGTRRRPAIPATSRCSWLLNEHTQMLSIRNRSLRMICSWCNKIRRWHIILYFPQDMEYTLWTIKSGSTFVIITLENLEGC